MMYDPLDQQTVKIMTAMFSYFPIAGHLTKLTCTNVYNHLNSAKVFLIKKLKDSFKTKNGIWTVTREPDLFQKYRI